MTDPCGSSRLGRRQILGLGLGAMATGLLGTRCATAATTSERVLSFDNLHTGDRLECCYWRAGKYDSEALAEINWVLRDHRTGDVFDIDVDLLDLIHDLRERVGTRTPVGIISGYRSPETNAQLAANSDGVAKNSYHLKGMATDFCLDGVDLGRLHKAAKAMGRGGVGAYYSSGFVHVDVGPVRYW